MTSKMKILIWFSMLTIICTEDCFFIVNQQKGLALDGTDKLVTVKRMEPDAARLWYPQSDQNGEEGQFLRNKKTNLVLDVQYGLSPGRSIISYEKKDKNYDNQLWKFNFDNGTVIESASDSNLVFHLHPNNSVNLERRSSEGDPSEKFVFVQYYGKSDEDKLVVVVPPTDVLIAG